METSQTLQPNEVKKTDFFSRIPEEDKRNLEALNSSLTSTVEKMGLKAHLLVVGGIINKPLPRKDIDVLVVFEEENLPKQDSFENYYLFSLEDFKKLEEVIKKIVEENQNFKIKEVHKPAIDEEFQSPALLKFGGSVKLEVAKGTQIEFIREPERGLEKVKASIVDKPFVIL